MRIPIVISILLNVSLLAVLGYRASIHPSEPSPTEEAIAQPTTKKPFVRPASQKTSNGDSSPIVPRFSWRNVESEDYKTYILHLREIECPEETIRDIIIADVSKYYAKRLQPLRKPVEEYKFWRTGNDWGGYRESAEYYKAQAQVEKEKRELLQELLGVDYMKEMRKQWGWGEVDSPTDAFSQEKKDQMAEIQSKYSALEMEIRRKAKGEYYEEDQTEIKKLQRERHDELAKILTPEELFEVEVRSSDLAQNMKWNELQGFNASEEEFRAIFKAKQASPYGEENGKNEDKATREQRFAVQKQVDEQLKQSLGKERYDELKLAENYEYRSLAQMVERQGLPKGTAKEIYSMRDEVEKAKRVVQADKNLTSEQRKERLAAIRAETEKAIIEKIGEKGYKSYKRNAWWIRNISP